MITFFESQMENARCKCSFRLLHKKDSQKSTYMMSVQRNVDFFYSLLIFPVA